MTRVIHKATLTPTGEQIVQLPGDAQIMHAAMQHGFPTLWYHCDPDAPKEPRTIRMALTGGEWVQNGRYLGTLLMADGAFVYHLFEVMS